LEKFRVDYSFVRINLGFGSIFEWAYFGCQVGYGYGYGSRSFGSSLG